MSRLWVGRSDSWQERSDCTRKPPLSNEIFVGDGPPVEAGRALEEGQAQEQVADVGEDEVIESTEEEVLPSKDLRTLPLPTQTELDEHRITHLPYRSWCPECVEGFGREAAHSSHKGRASWIPVISCDYLYLSARGVYMRKEWVPVQGEPFLKILVIHVVI